MIRLSKTSKLDGILSWSLQARDTCPGSIEGGELVPACAGCYAVNGNYRYPNVKQPRLENREDWQRLEWVDDMVKALDSSRYFRWLDSGDLYSVALAEKVLEVMQRTPWVSHWLPTRMHKFPKFRRVFEKMQRLPNVALRFSSDSVTGEYIKGLHGSVIIPTAEQLPKGAKLCQAYDHGGKCNGCRACYDKKTAVIAYPAHGKTMQKVIKLEVIKNAA